MPGITGCSSNKDLSIIENMKNQTYKSEYIHEFFDPAVGVALQSLYHKSMILTRDNITIALYGYIVNTNKTGESLMNWLIDLFMSKGELFVKELKGSFHLVVYNQEQSHKALYLYSDWTSSRQLFYLIQDNTLYFCPEILPLVSILENPSVDTISLVQFMISGYFPSGRTVFQNIKMLKPGSYIIWKDNTIEHKKYFIHNFSDPFSEEINEQVELLNKSLQKVITDYWKHSADTGILLSGGYDSQYILYTIAEYVNDTTQLKTISWGQNPTIKGSDLHVASRIARKLGTKHIVIDKNTNHFEQEYKEMFYAQSGMTDSTLFHSNELTSLKILKSKYAIGSLFRGDECFGFGDEAFHLQNALVKIHMSLPQYTCNINQWFDTSHADLIDQYSTYLNKKISHYDLQYNDLKDTLYFNERLSMMLQPLNYFKHHFQEVYNPLIDVDILKIIQKIPSSLRSDKWLFKQCLLKKFNKQFPVEFSTKDNMVKWSEEIRNREKVNTFVYSEIGNLHYFFNKPYFYECFNTIINNRIPLKVKMKEYLPAFITKRIQSINERIHKKLPRQYYIAPESLISRAIILSEWLNRYYHARVGFIPVSGRPGGHCR